MINFFRTLFRKDKLDAEMVEEMRAHVELQAERHIAAGMNPDEARYLAQRQFGNAAGIHEHARDARGWVWVEQARQDVRYAVRSLGKSPSFTITAVLTLAFGIGVNAALFGFFDKVALQPLPVKDPDSLVRISGLTAQGGSRPEFSHAKYLAYRDGSRTLDGLLAYRETKWSLQSGTVTGSDPAFDVRDMGTVPVELVSGNYFDVLGGTMLLGRGFLPEEIRAGERRRSSC